MKIFLIIPTLKQGGSERVIAELANYFCIEHQIYLVLLAKSNDFYSVNEKITIHRLGFANKNRIFKILYEIKVFLKLRNLVKKQKPDAILSFGDKFNIFTLLATLGLNVSVFVSDRSNPKKKIPIIRQLLKRTTYRQASGIIAQTTTAREILVKTIDNNNIIVIPNPIKTIVKDPYIKREKIILNVGRLVAEKGQKYLIDAFTLINDKDWKLVILGEGILRGQLEKQIEANGLENRVLLQGITENIDSWLAKASIFAFSSVSEGFPNALIEAMSAGLPCVSFDCDAGPNDIICNSINGYLVDVKDIQKFSEKINLLIKDSNLRKTIGKEAEKISENLSIDIIAERYLNFFSKKM